MPVGESGFVKLRKDALKYRPENVERTAWLQLLLSVLTQLDGQAGFPSYNVVLGATSYTLMCSGA